MPPSYESILARLREQLQALAPEHVTIGEDSELMDQLGLDSVQLLDLVMEIEDEFDIVVPVSALADVHTPRQLAALIYHLEAGE